MRIRGHTCVAVAAFSLVCATSWAETTFLPLTDDAHINANQAGVNFGLANDMVVHAYGPKYALVRFDAASVGGQIINSATLEVFLTSIKASGTVDVHIITSSWNESAVNWNNRPLFEAVPFVAVGVATSDQGSVVSIDVTSAVGRWADGDIADAGLLISTDDGIKAFFQSKEKGGANPPTLSVDFTDSGPSVGTGEAGPPPKVLDLSKLPVVIDEPGHYVVDQNWQLDVTSAVYDGVVRIAAAPVKIDLRGFEIDVDADLGHFIVVEEGAGATIENGSIRTNFFEDVAIYASGTTTIVDMKIYGGGNNWSVVFERIGRISSTDMNGGGASFLGPSGLLEFSNLRCLRACLEVDGENVVVSGNKISSLSDDPGDGRDNRSVRIDGSNNIFRSNIVSTEYQDWSLIVNGSSNLIAENTFRPTFSTNAIQVSGSGNIIVENTVLALVDPPGTPGAQIGIRFLGDGNSYGDNRVSAVVPFDLGATTQVDLGGNAGL